MKQQQNVTAPVAAKEKDNNGEYLVRRNRIANIIAAVVCVLLAVFIWCAVMNIEITKRVPLSVATNENYSYSLSTTAVTVTGSRAALRRVFYLSSDTIFCVSEAMTSSSLVSITNTLTLESGAEISLGSGSDLTASLRSASSFMPR